MKLAAPALTLLVAMAAAAAPIDAETSASVLADARRLASAMLAEDYERLATSMHPKVREMLGGAEATVTMARESMGQLAAAGMKVESFEVSDPTDLHAATDEIVIFVPTRMSMTTPMGRILATGYFVASRPKGGGAWAFIDGAGVADGTVSLASIFPGLPADATPPETSVAMAPSEEGAPSAAPATAGAEAADGN